MRTYFEEYGSLWNVDGLPVQNPPKRPDRTNHTRSSNPAASAKCHRRRTEEKHILDRCAETKRRYYARPKYLHVLLGYALERQQALSRDFALELDDQDIVQLLPVTREDFIHGVRTLAISTRPNRFLFR